MLAHLEGRASERKFRLFIAAGWACRCRADKRIRRRVGHIVRYTEQMADGRYTGKLDGTDWIQLGEDAFAAAVTTARLVSGARDDFMIPRREQADLIRCIFGDPFRPVAVDPAWLTSDVLTLARGIYDEKAFDRLPILADALQDAGCEDEALLSHCRGPGPHVRGCWVADLVLGKE
jgi:hypothetical protein